MIIHSLEIPREDFEAQSGWKLKPEGACKGDVCVPLPVIDTNSHTVDVRMIADTLGMPIVHDEVHGLYAVGPASDGPLLSGPACPEITLPDLDGNEISISSFRGSKVVIVSWASW